MASRLLLHHFAVYHVSRSIYFMILNCVSFLASLAVKADMSVIVYEVVIEWHKWSKSDVDKFLVLCREGEDIALKCEDEAYRRRISLNGIAPSIPIIASLKVKDQILET